MMFRLLFTLLVFCCTAALHAQLTYNELIVQYDSAWTFKNLQLIPVKFKAPGTGLPPGEGRNELVTLQQAMLQNKAKIKEIIYQKGADVNWVEVTNTSKQTVVINSGALLAGGKQDRVIAETKILRPGKKDYLKVFCIEKGRWDKKPKSFAYSGNSDPSLKRIMDKTGRQQEVWKEIERQYDAEKLTSGTYPYLKINRTATKLDLDYIVYFTNKYKQSDSLFAGFLSITANKIINCELFASTDMTHLAFDDMLRNLVAVAVAKGAPPTLSKDDMEQFMDKLLMNNEAQKTFLTTHGKMDVQDGKVIHLVAYGD